MSQPRPLKHIKKSDLAPVWARLDISMDRIAETLGVTRQALSSKAKTLGLPSRAGNREPQKKIPDQQFIKMWNAGVNTTDIARHFGYSRRSAVSKRREMLNLPARQRAKGSNKNHCGWVGTISLTRFLEDQLAEKMKCESPHV